VYVTNQSSGNVTVIDGATNAASTVNVGNTPGAVAVNPVTNRVYVANYNSNDVTVIDGATNAAIATVGAGTNPVEITVNPVTNKVYVLNRMSNNVTVIDGVTNVATATVGVGTDPEEVAVNPVTNKVYVVNQSSNNVTVIDGATNVVSNIGVGTIPESVTVNTVTNKVYIANFSNNNITVIDVDGNHASPVMQTVSGVADSLTVSAAGDAVFQTMNTSPQFTDKVTSNYTYGTPPAPTAVYYVVDGYGVSPMQVVTAAPGSGNPATFTVNLANMSIGVHTLYLYAATEADGGSSALPYGNSPDLSSVAAYTFAVLPLPTTTTVSADVNPQNSGGSVTFTATVSSTYSGDPTGTVSFFDGSTLLGSATLQHLSGSYQATYTTSALAAGSRTITAIYSGDGAFANSSGTMTEKIAGPVATLTVASGDGQSANIGTAFANPIVVKAVDSNGIPVPGAAVGFSGTGIIFSIPLHGITTDANGLASVSATPTQAGSLAGTATSNGKSVNFTLTGNKIMPTVTLSSSANPSTTGQSVTLTATVSDSATGTVAFKDNGTTISTCTSQPITSGAATCVLSTLTAGTHPITAAYTTDNTAKFNNSTSTTPLSQSVAGAVATVTVVSGGGQSAVAGTALANPIVVKAVDSNGTPVPGVSVSFTGTGITYAPNPATTGPDGTVSVTVTPTGTGTLTGTITAGGKTTTFTVTGTAPPPPPDFTATPTSPTSVTVSATSGGAASYTFTVSAVGGFTGDVKLTANPSPALPTGVVPVFTPSSTVKPGDTVTMTITLAKATASLRSYSPLAFALLLLPVMLIGKARNLRIRGLLMVVLAFGAIAGVIGCGGGSSSSGGNGGNGGGGGGGTRTPTTYTITVTGTSTSGSISHPVATFTLTQ
ncbi:MAG: Ig-like domain repeat protein, partial [Acidobacteriaceae bacterium]|nr:Ig-like domain repeat protein [Acidobacteriaceae bacterium]